MPRVSKIARFPPHAVAQALTTLGRNICTARLRRKVTRADLAYLGALWALGLLKQMDGLVDPDRDIEGKTLESARSPKTAPKRRSVDDDF